MEGQDHILSPCQGSSPPRRGACECGETLEVPDPISPLEQEFLNPIPGFLVRQAPVWAWGVEG